MSSPNLTPILVVRSSEFDRLGRFQGFSNEAERYLDALFAPGIAEFRPRAEMEVDPNFKQIIPYVVFRSGDRIFRYTRGKSGGEARLHRLVSIGIGGHVDESDADGRATLEAYEIALRRELDEEVEIGSTGTIRRVGLINDDSSPVGQVHLGVVHLFELDTPSVTAREEGIAESGFSSIAEIAEISDQLETWSRFALTGFLLDGKTHA